ncbi:hypothetical protein TSOC_008334 [Tetrabaena socialis]|uniref:EGF-like domain-containing protein n=1 Tax=Tetrabaena socialis TaxID=47790 RepID=A0A2J7ZYR6_9CHLO|nr:hypothetical protein TSOC_008334 [Tetrabaena socialis]|eukprot:PNH05410.1 hypothetical protein TSOC_008334 [Tetrabaena socialis]
MGLRRRSSQLTLLVACFASVQHFAYSQISQERKPGKERRLPPLTETTPLTLRCAPAVGDWCHDFLTQEVSASPAWRSLADPALVALGLRVPLSRFGMGRRTNEDRRTDDSPMSFIGPDKRDLNWTQPGVFIYGRCGGVCDDDTAICYCDGPMGRIPAPEGSPPGTPPIRRGRPLVSFQMAPKTAADGQRAFGEQEYDHVYGPSGYCNVSAPVWAAVCGLDDLAGPTCDEPVEAFCPGACSGHGRCNLGFCICEPGYYGHDCARRRAGLPLLPSAIPTTPWLASVLREPPAAREPPPAATRRRPLIYVYDLEPLYQAKLMQYRYDGLGTGRGGDIPGNATVWSDMWVYAADTLLHESLLISEHRTFDPEEADFFYIPHAASCLPFPIGAWADYPWFKGPGGPRVRQMINMLMETVEWIDQGSQEQ